MCQKRETYSGMQCKCCSERKLSFQIPTVTSDGIPDPDQFIEKRWDSNLI